MVILSRTGRDAKRVQNVKLFLCQNTLHVFSPIIKGICWTFFAVIKFSRGAPNWNWHLCWRVIIIREPFFCLTEFRFLSAILDHRALQYFSPEELDKSRAQSDDIGILRWVRESVKYYAKDKDCCAVACATPNPKIGWTQPFLLGFAPSYRQGVQTSYRLLSNIPKFKKFLNGVGLGDFSKFLWGLKFIPNLLGHPVGLEEPLWND